MGIIEAYGVLRAVHLDQQIQAVQLLGILLGGGKPGNPLAGAGPPTPTAGPLNPTGKPRPTGLLTPGPAAKVGNVAVPPGALAPNRDDGSAGGGPSTEQETIWVPRTIVNPNVRFSSDSTSAGCVLPGAD